MKNELMTIDYKAPEVVKTLKETVAQGATDAEFAMFAELCKSTGLNPFKKEVWFIKTKGYTKKDGTEVQGRVQIMTGINGFLAIANSNQQFDGLECEVAYEKDGITPKSATAKVYRKDRKIPSTATALWREYYKPNPYGNKGVWEQMPSIMIAKCAKSLALREAFPQELNGLYTAEEMPADYQPERLPALKTADALAIEQNLNASAAEVFGDDDIPQEPQPKAKKPAKKAEAQPITHYDLASYMAAKPELVREALARRLKALGGNELSAGFWAVPKVIEELAEYIVEEEAPK